MALFQPSVLNKYLKLQDKEVTAKAYKKFTKHFHNVTIQENIKNSKEEEAQALKTQIDQTDREIDQLVYKLYELTPEEIEIVENS